MPLWSKLTPSRGHMLEHRNIDGKLKKFSSLELVLVDLYQVCLYDAPEFKIGPAPGQKMENRQKANQLQNSSSLKLEGMDIWYVTFPSAPLPSLVK